MEKTWRAAIEFSLTYRSSCAVHMDRIYLGKVDFWRDIFPGSIRHHLVDMVCGERFGEDFKAGVLVPSYRSQRLVRLSLNNSSSLVPGRFYPKDIAWKHLNTFPGDRTPCRIVEKNDSEVIVDTNHPLAQYPLTVEAEILCIQEPVRQRGGSLHHITEILTQNGPGMQIPLCQSDCKLLGQYPFERRNNGNDKAFYCEPRLVHHLDSRAREHVQAVFFRLVRPKMRVLDLMSSWQSHLPDQLKTCEVVGLGMNKEELQANRWLKDFYVQDLNKNIQLPFTENTFDAVLCTVSIEYLISPLEVLAETFRVLTPGGICILIVSDRWFEGKEILPWADLHEFERLGLLMQYFLEIQTFVDLHTESIRGYPRPPEDKYFHQCPDSDPLFIAWAYKPL